MSTRIDSRQIKKRQALPRLGTIVDSTVETILSSINTEIDSPLRMTASTTPDAQLNFSSSSIVSADNSNKVVSPVKKQVFNSNLVNPFINFQTQALSSAAHFDITFPTSTVGRFRYVGFTLIGSSKIKVLFSAESVTEGALSNPGALFINGGLPLGYISLECTNTLGYFKTSGSATNIIENAKIFKFSAGGGTSSASSSNSGGELSDLLYSAKISDALSEIPDGTTTVDIAAAKTDATLHDVANELIRISYDASKTVTGTSTAMTLSGTPAFTVKTGDILTVGVEARVITALSSQTAYTIEAAFTTNPAAFACNVSQAIHTVDLNAFTAGGLGLAASSQFSGNIEEILVGYDDTATLGDIIPNFGVAPVISYSASADLTNWTTLVSRVNSLSTPESFVTMPVASTNLGLRFFSNAVSGSGAVNLLGYKVFFHKQLANIAGASYLTAFARPTASIAQNCAIGLVSGKTRFTFTFPYTMGLNSGEASGSVLEVSANGQIVPRYSAGITDDTQAFFKEINGSTIEMDTDYTSAGIDFQFKVQRVNIIDTNTQNTVKNTLHDDLFDQNLDAQVIVPWLTAVNASPTASQFRSDITGRANIPDLSSMLSVQMGPARMQVQDYYQLQSEFGPAGQPVFGVVNDKFNQMRFVGSWTNNNNVDGAYLGTIVSGDYAEIVFWGTGINICFDADDAGIALNYSLDGGAPTAITIPTYSVILGARNYAANQILNIVSAQGLGLHTVKVIQNATVEFKLQGFEVLTETTSLRVLPGTVAKGKYKNVLSSIQTVAYDSSFETGTLGTRGGCVLVYLKNDGTIGKAVTPTDSAAGYLSGASHVNEEVIRTHHFREFGAGRADDFSAPLAAGAIVAFTLDDGITTVAGNQVLFDTGFNAHSISGAFYIITFVGTGIDINVISIGSVTFNAFLDGVQIATASTLYNLGQTKIASGLPYGTHTLKVVQTGALVGGPRLASFIVYAPKKPLLPVSSIELGMYYKNADYVAASSGNQNFIGSGVQRKNNLREVVYVGTWVLVATPDPVTFDSGWNLSTVTATTYLEYTFFGTGFVYTGLAQTGGAQNSTMLVDGLALNAGTNIGSSSSIVQSSTGLTFSAAGALGGTPAAQNHYRISITGLALGKHTVRMTNNSTQGLYFDGFDIISPIHAPVSNGPYVLQNTLTLGNNSVIDLRKFNKRDLALANQSKSSQAIGVNSNPLTTSTSLVPIPDMSSTHYNVTGKIRINYAMSLFHSATGVGVYNAIYVDGKIVGVQKIFNAAVLNYLFESSDTLSVNVSPGFHKIDIYWFTSSGTLTAYTTTRNLLVEDV